MKIVFEILCEIGRFDIKHSSMHQFESVDHVHIHFKVGFYCYGIQEKSFKTFDPGFHIYLSGFQKYEIT